MNISRRKFLSRAAVAVPAAALAVPLAVKAVEAHVAKVETVADHGDTPFVASGKITFNNDLIVEPHGNTDKTYAFCRADDCRITLWCVKREDGKTFWVINGHWIYDPADPQWPAAVLMWEGVAPFNHDEYNEAMAWIQEQVYGRA